MLHSQTIPVPDAKALVQKIQTEITGPFPLEDAKENPDVPHGELIRIQIKDSAIYPGTENDIQVYVPAQYDPAKPACLLLKLDGMNEKETSVFDNLIAKKDIPILIGVGITPGRIWKDPVDTPDRQTTRYNRSYEFDSVNGNFPDFVLNEVLPAVQKLKTKDGRAVKISPEGNDHAVTGASTGGIGSFTLAWRRPDQFSRVYALIGTFVSMRGGHEYPALIRKTEPKPIRIFLEDGTTDTWNPLFGSWYEANLNMESALSFSGYDVAHVWGEHGHDAGPGWGVLPDVLRWLWRDYPAPIRAGISHNNALEAMLLPGEGWEEIKGPFQSVTGLAADHKGEIYLSDDAATTVFHLGEGNKTGIFSKGGPGLSGLAFGADGTLYGIAGAGKEVLAIDPHGKSRKIAEGIAGHGLVVTPDGSLYVSEPGEHSDMPSKIWKISAGGEKNLMDEGLLSASGIGFSPDGGLFFAAESGSKWIYSYVVQADGSFVNKQPFYWLHMTDIPSNSGAEELAVDRLGNLYVATRMGIQVCDQNGRVRAILPLPTPSAEAKRLCFGGKDFDFLYATDGKQLFRRKFKLQGHAPWSKAVAYPSQGGA